MAESKGAAKTAGTAEEGAAFMSGPGSDHPNADYNDPGATGPAPMAPVYPDALDTEQGKSAVDGGTNSGSGTAS